jgi:hypothetical protein
MPKREGRKRGKDKKKDTFKNYGKNTTRGLRIKQAELEKRAEKRKNSQVQNNENFGKKRVEKGKVRYDYE